MRRLSELIETLRPNGPLTEQIQQIIDAIKKKVERLRRIISELQTLADLLRDGFAGTELSLVLIESSSGNEGFKEGLNSSTGHPEFDSALVFSAVLYAGGPSIEPLKLLFSDPGTKISNTYADSKEKQEAQAGRPVLNP